MSYRTRIQDVQIFGNNEYYEEWIDFLESKGIEVDEDGCYDGEIDDLQGMFNVIDKITQRLIEERHNRVKKGEKSLNGKPITELADLSQSIWLDDKTPLLRYNIQIIENAYIFLPYQVYLAVENIIEETNEFYHGYKNWAFCTYKLKDGEKIHVSAC